WRFSRAYRLLFMATRALRVELTTPPPAGGANVEVVVDAQAADGSARRTVRYGEHALVEVRTPAKAGVVGWDVALARNLEEIVARSRASGSAPVLLTYPAFSGMYGQANVVIRDVATKTSALLVDLGSEFEHVCPDVKCPELLFPDQHPTAKG